MGEKQPAPEQKQQGWSAHHYETMAKWTKDIALLLFASLVVQEVMTLRSVASSCVVAGAVVSFAAYGAALSLLRKSSCYESITHHLQHRAGDRIADRARCKP